MSETTHGIPNPDETTARDRVFAAVLEETRHTPSFKLKTLKTNFPVSDRPSDETIRRVLRSLTRLGVLEHRDGSPYYELSDDYGGR